MILVLKKVKSPYVTSVAQNGHVTHKPEADGALILPPLPSPSPPPSLSLRFTGIWNYSKVHGKESQHGRAVGALDLQFGDPEFKSRPDR